MVKVLFVGLTNDRLEVSTHFAMSLLRLQMEAAGMENFEMAVTFLNTLNDALNVAAKDESVDTLVAVDTRVSFPPGFVLQDQKKDFVVGAYPLPVTDWDRLSRACKTTSKEPLERAGNVYNVVPKAETIDFGTATVAIASVKSLGAVKLTKKALLGLALAAPTADSGEKLFHVEAIDGGAYLSKNEFLMKLHNRDVFADLEHPCSFTGAAEFAGCVGQRETLR